MKAADRLRQCLQYLPAILLAAGAVILMAQTVGRILAEWRTNSVCEHVPFTLPVAMAVLIERLWRGRAECGGSAGRWHFAGVCLAVIGAAFFWLDASMHEVFFLELGLWFGGLAAVLLLAGGAMFRQVLFPFLLLTFAIAPPQGITQLAVHHQLQQITATAAAGLVSLAGFDIRLAGTALHLDSAYLDIAEPCSGYRFMIVLLFNALVIGMVVLGQRIFSRAMLAGAAMFVALVTNTIRIAAAVVVMHVAGQSAAGRFLHGPAVWLVYLAGSLVLVMAACAWTDTCRQAVPGDQEGEPRR